MSRENGSHRNDTEAGRIKLMELPSVIEGLLTNADNSAPTEQNGGEETASSARVEAVLAEAAMPLSSAGRNGSRESSAPVAATSPSPGASAAVPGGQPGSFLIQQMAPQPPVVSGEAYQARLAAFSSQNGLVAPGMLPAVVAEAQPSSPSLGAPPPYVLGGHQLPGHMVFPVDPASQAYLVWLAALARGQAIPSFAFAAAQPSSASSASAGMLPLLPPYVLVGSQLPESLPGQQMSSASPALAPPAAPLILRERVHYCPLKKLPDLKKFLHSKTTFPLLNEGHGYVVLLIQAQQRPVAPLYVTFPYIPLCRGKLLEVNGNFYTVNLGVMPEPPSQSVVLVEDSLALYSLIQPIIFDASHSPAAFARFFSRLSSELLNNPASSAEQANGDTQIPSESQPLVVSEQVSVCSKRKKRQCPVSVSSGGDAGIFKERKRGQQPQVFKGVLGSQNEVDPKASDNEGNNSLSMG